MHIVDMLFFWARVEPHRLAVIQPELLTTFQGLADAIESIGERIDGLGLDPREPVAVSIANPSFLLATAFALLRHGFSIAPVTPPLYPHLRSAGIRHLIYDNVGQVASGGRNIRFDMSWMPSPTAVRKPYNHRPAGNGDLISFTSGTTGLPKPIVRSMKGLTHRFSSPLTYADSKVMIAAGLAGGYGFMATCAILYAGKTACFAPFGEAVLGLIGLFGIDTMVASPQQALALADLNTKSVGYDLSSLKTLRLSGSALTREAARRIKTNLCRNIIVRYASTEAGTTAMAPYDLIGDIPGAVGYLLPEVEIEIVDEAGTVLPAGSEGLVRLRTPQFLANIRTSDTDPPSDAKSRWFYPGDIGRVTEHGVLCLAGRSSDVINRGGVKVAAGKIQEIVEALPEIMEAAACGIEGDSGMEEVWIAIVPRQPIDVVEIKSRLQQHDYIGAMVDEVFLVQQLPRSDVGKIQKLALKEMLLRLKKGY